VASGGLRKLVAIAETSPVLVWTKRMGSKMVPPAHAPKAVFLGREPKPERHKA
jgi:hypothetical protein